MPTRPRSSKPAVQGPPARDAPAAFTTVERIELCVSGGQGRRGVEELREVVGAHVPALDVADCGGVGEAVAEEAGSALGSERDRDHGWERLVAGELARAGDERADVGRDDAGLGVGDARHVAVGVGEVAEGEGVGLADDAQVLVDADVAAFVAAVRQCSALEVLAVGPHAEGAKPDVGDELAAVGGGDGDRGERRGRSAGQLGERGAQSQLDAERVELAAQLVAQGLVVGTDEDVVGDVGDRDVLIGEERLDLAGELEAGRAGTDDQRAVGGEQRLVGGAVPRFGGGDVGFLGLGREWIGGPVASTR
jgi:hypothetical protein